MFGSYCQISTIRSKHRFRYWVKLPCLKVGWRCRSPPATRKMASSANWTSNLETPSPWRPTARWWWSGTPRRTARGGRRTWAWPRLRSLRTPTLPFCWHLCEMSKNTYPSSLHITESKPFKCQMPDAKPQIKLAVEERKQIAWMSWNQSFSCDVYKLIVISAENMNKVKASFFSFSPSGVSLRCGVC